MKKFNYYLSVFNQVVNYLFVFGVLFLIQRYFFGLFMDYEKFTLFGYIYIHDIVFTVTSIITIMLFYRSEKKYFTFGEHF